MALSTIIFSIIFVLPCIEEEERKSSSRYLTCGVESSFKPLILFTYYPLYFEKKKKKR